MSGRDRYPSDEAWNAKRHNLRLIRPHVRIHHSMTDHPRTSVVWRDNDLLAGTVRILNRASEKGAAHTGDCLVIPIADVQALMGCSRRDRAVHALGDLAAKWEWKILISQRYGATSAGKYLISLGCTFVDSKVVTELSPVWLKVILGWRQSGDKSVVLWIRNFAKKQNITPRKPSGDAAELRHFPSPHYYVSSTVVEDTRAADAAPPPTKVNKSFEEIIWTEGLRYLTDHGDPTENLGRRTRKARTFLGKLRKDYSDENVAAALVRAQKTQPSDPYPWLLKMLAQHMRMNGAARKVELLHCTPPETLEILPKTKIIWHDAKDGALNGHQTNDGVMHLVRGQARFLP